MDTHIYIYIIHGSLLQILEAAEDQDYWEVSENRWMFNYHRWVFN